MSIYITRNLNPGGTSMLSFLERNLGGRAPGQITSSGIYPAFSAQPLGLGFAISNISKIFAISQVPALPISDKGYVKAITNVAVPVSAPLLLLNPKTVKAFSPEELSGMNFGRSSEIREGTWSGRPTYEHLIQMWARLDHIYSVGASMVNPAGLYAFHVAWKAVGIFQNTIGRIIGEFPLPRVTGANMMDVTETATGDSGMDDNDRVWELDAMEIPGTTVDVTPSNYWTSPTMMIKQRGHVFPYFAGMIEPTPDFLFSTFVRLFSRCLATSADDTARLLQVLRPGFRSLYSTNQGQELSHVYFGIQLAVDTGAKLHIIISNNTYLGFALLTKDSLLVNDSVREALRPTELSHELRNLDKHYSACEEVHTLLTEIDGNLAYTVEEVAASSRAMAKAVYSVEVPTEQRQPLVDLLNRTSYNDTYITATPENIIIALRKMASNSWEWDEAPFYLRNGTALSDNIITRVLAAFGPRAPFFNSTTGPMKRYNLLPAPPVNLQGEDSIRYLPYAIGSIQQAAASFQRLISNRSLDLPAPRANKNEWVNMKDRTPIASGTPLFRETYDSLRALAMSGSVSGPRGTKRASDAEEPPSKKRKDEERTTLSKIASLM